MTLSKLKQEKIYFLLSQDIPIHKIAKEVGASTGAIWNYKTGNHRNKKQKPVHKQVTPPQPEFTPKESLSATMGNTESENLVEPDILRPENCPEMQVLRIAEQQQNRRQEQNQKLAEYQKEQFENRKKENAKEDEWQALIDRKIADVKQLREKKQREQRDKKKLRY